MKRLIFTKENRLASIREVNPKNQTRRVIVPQPTIDESGKWNWPHKAKGILRHGLTIEYMQQQLPECAPYQVGDILGMPEPYIIYDGRGQGDDFYGRIHGRYLDDNKEFLSIELTEEEFDKWQARKKPYASTQARFMYNSLIRHFVKVTKVRVEMLQDISEEDAKAEGIVCTAYFNHEVAEGIQEQCQYRPSFHALWDSINEKRGYGWDTNPWNFVYDYEREVKK